MKSNNPMKALKRAKIAKALEMQKEADKLPSLTPEVKWAQNPEALSITISLSQVMKPEIKINGNTLEFCASGVGATGQRRNYEFELDFFDHVDRKGFHILKGRVLSSNNLEIKKFQGSPPPEMF